MERRDDTRTELNPWLEQLAWNAAALAALAVMLLVLLGSLEWLDRMTPAPAPKAAAHSVRAADRPARAPVVATGIVGRAGTVADGEGCAAPARGSG